MTAYGREALAGAPPAASMAAGDIANTARSVTTATARPRGINIIRMLPDSRAFAAHAGPRAEPHVNIVMRRI
jgi:hypothetical protein